MSLPSAQSGSNIPCQSVAADGQFPGHSYRYRMKMALKDVDLFVENRSTYRKGGIKPHHSCAPI